MAIFSWTRRRQTMNEVASPCCGSCKHFYYDDNVHDFCCHNIKADPYNVATAESMCTKAYSPRNPIPLINVPGVKEMVAKAYRDGFRQGIDIDKDNYAEVYEENNIYEYMRALEDKR